MKKQLNILILSIILIVLSSFKSNKESDFDCPDCYGTLMRTYQIEYCVGQKCRTRELYRCNYNFNHSYWIYTN
jgi:hypothetical protein